MLAPSGLFAPVSREGALVVNNILLCSMAAVVFTGTTYPMFANLIGGAQISVGAPFFNATVLPLAIPLFAVMSLGPLLAWKRAALAPAIRKLWWAALAALAVGLVTGFGLGRALAALAFAGAAWLVLGAFAEIVERIRLFRLPLTTSLARLAGVPRSVWGSSLGHAGMGVTMAGIAGMSLAMHTIVALHPGESVGLGGYRWTLSRLYDAPGPNFTARVAEVTVTRDGRVVATLTPSRRSYALQRNTVTDTSIRTNLLRDLYTALGEERDGAVVLRLHVNPLAPWIWLGALVMAAGGALSLSDRRLRVGAPARHAAATVPA